MSNSEMNNLRRNFILRFANTLEPQELVRIGGPNVPLEVVPVNEDQNGNAIGNPDEPVPLRVAFRLSGGEIVPGLTYDTLGPQQLVRSGGENDPLDVKITIVNEHQLSMAMGPQAGPVPPRYEFCVIDGKIIPGLSSEEPVLPDVDFLLGLYEKIIPALSSGIRFHSDFERLPVHDQQNPERLWKLQRVTTQNDLQMYPKEITIVLENAYNGQYLIKPAEPVRLETFIQILRCLPWLKMYTFRELRDDFLGTRQ